MTMNTYTQWLNLDFDPFVPGAKSSDFYCSGQRQNLLDQIVEFSLYSNAMIAVIGPLGAGKTTLATNFCDRFADEAVCVKVAAALFMSQSQFLEKLQDALGFKPTGTSDSNSSIEQICGYAAELDLEASSLILIIDDAHELSDEVLHLLTKLLVSCVDSSIHALLFGENQLDILLQSTLTIDVKERLAVFPLDGFASDETQEYIRFKLATARFTKELPIDGGIVGAIHNSSLGMPGAINSLVVDALNAAAPARERDEFADIGLVYSGDRIAQDDEHEGIEALDGSNPDVKISPLVSIQPRYWFAAATLVVMLAGTLLFGEKGPRETESIPISVAVTPKTTQAIEVEPVAELPAAVPEQPAAVGVAVAELEEFPLSDVADFDESNSAATSSIEEVVVAESIPLANNGAEINDSLLVVPADVAGPIVEIAVVEETVVIATASAFVEQLLQASPRDYAVQLLASYSEANISKFVAQLNSDHPAGYFETRYQGKPWFVAVLAAFDDRDEAARSILSLSAKLRSNEPWARSVAGIQTDIQELLDSKLVSLK
jgi:DamX protein